MKVTVGRLVNYVLEGGEVRPLLIVRVWNDDGYINGLLFVDGSNDDGKVGIYGDTQFAKNPVVWKTSVFYKAVEEGKPLTPFTWHWPERV